LFAFGAVILLLYTWPLKYLGLGELMIFLIWGPVMVTGVYLVLAGGVWTDNLWSVALAGIPFGLSVVSINIGKHIYKSEADRSKGVGTLPVRIGEKAARYANIGILILIYLIILYQIFVPRFFTPVMLIVFLAIKRLIQTVGVHSQPRPVKPPKGWPAWPTWFSGFAFHHNRLFSEMLILGLIADCMLRVFLPSFWR
jgi:1,4-dihydroxy-2-naphthoate octaprenyltransferase